MVSTKHKILDTNVLVNANGDQSPQTSPDCKQRCLQLLFSAMVPEYQLVIDGGGHPEGSEILAEYRDNLRESGSGYGDMFFRWLLNNWQHHMRVPITKEDSSYQEFPVDKRLQGFDPSDHKWIATANACQEYEDVSPLIVQSSDLKWREYADTFSEHGIEIDFLCHDGPEM